MLFFFNFFKRSYSKINQYLTMSSSKLKVYKVQDYPDIHHLYKRLVNEDGLKFLQNKFNQHNHEIRIAGGAIRDLLCKKYPDDIDLATVAKPDQMVDILTNLDNVRLIQTQAGKKHGTLVVRIDNKWQYELTTLRIDVLTNGRHAEVEFIQDWNLDASRRDLTINSMFLDFNGNIFDYFNGVEHLREKKILFVGNAENRINEDFLRILRYFRFYARYGNLKDHDELTSKTIIKCKEGLKTISGERKWSELKKILILPNSYSVIEGMFNYFDLNHYLGFNEGKKDFKPYLQVYKNLDKFKIMDIKEKQLIPIILLTSLINDTNELINIRNTLKLSNAEMFCSYCILNLLPQKPTLKNLKTIIFQTPKSDLSKKREQLLSYLIYIGDLEAYDEFKNYVNPKFPDLIDTIKNKVKNPNEIGNYLKILKNTFAENDFKLTKQELIEEFNQLYEIENNKNKMN